MTLLNSYEVLSGEKFDKITSNFDTSSILHFAHVQVENGDFDFLLLDKEVFNTIEDGYFFVRRDKPFVYSNLNDSQIARSFMYMLMLQNDEAMEDPNSYFDSKVILDKVKGFQRQKQVKDFPKDKSIIYQSDNEIISNFVTKKFSKYIVDCQKLQNYFTFVFESRHHSFFDRLKTLKNSFNAHKVEMSSVDSLKEEGIYISPLFYEAIKQALRSLDHILISGPTGCGKSVIMFYLIRTLGIKYVTIECNESKRYDELFGSTTLDENNKLVPSLGKIATAFRDGHTLILEEFTALSDKNFKALLTLMHHDELNLELDDRKENGQYEKNLVIPRHPDFRIIATANEEKRYNVNALTPQVKRRFQTIIPLNYLPEKEEINFVSQRLNKKGLEVNEENIKNMVVISNKLRNLNLVVSTASVAIWAEKSTIFGLRDSSLTSYVPQIVFSKNDLKTVNDVFSLMFTQHEPIVMAI